jgi:uncharacterized damage-inducible protein DinB
MIPTPEFFRHYFEYVVWADRRQLDLVRELPEEEHCRERGFSFGSIHKVLTHELAAQSVWLDRFEGVPPVWLMDDPRFGALSAVEQHWATVHERGRKYFAALTSDRLAANLTYTNLRGDRFTLPLWELMFHMCQHSYYHRSQLNSMIKQAGGTPKSVDYSIWAAERGT